jgi:hypothetical protein
VSSISGKFNGNNATKRGSAYETLLQQLDPPTTDEIANTTLATNETTKTLVELLHGYSVQEWIEPYIHSLPEKRIILQFSGRTDYISPDRTLIIDLKTTQRPLEQVSYIHSLQADIYALATGITSFAYIIVQFDDETSLEPVTYKREDKTIDLVEAQTRVHTKALEYITFLQTTQGGWLWDIYKDRYKLHP